jgi:hypothetical protein
MEFTVYDIRDHCGSDTCTFARWLWVVPKNEWFYIVMRSIRLTDPFLSLRFLALAVKHVLIFVTFNNHETIWVMEYKIWSVEETRGWSVIGHER